ncbi:MAG: hypothetical protein GQ546_01440, partial [Gammaproteobacteria bacterium]|nr:hypothetical protein [Gammaproteobacteria bacterium]
MCIAIPYGKDKINESRFWRALRTRPLYMLGLGALIQILFLAVFWLALSSEFISRSSLLISPAMISTYSLLFSFSGFLFFALSMHVYPKRMQSGEIEYLYYGAFFFLATYNSAFFYFASFNSIGLIITSIIIYFALAFFTFKPLWRAYFWADKQSKNFGRAVNFVFSLLVLGQLIFFIN